MKTELRQKARLIVFLFLTITAMAPRAQAQFTINNPSSFGTQSVGQVEFGLSTSNGTGPSYTWTLESGALPDGVSIRTDLPGYLVGGSSTAVLAGIATTPGTFNFTIGVTDSLANHASKSFSIKISSLVVKDWFNLPDSFLGVAYSHTLTAMRDGAPVTAVWSGTGYTSSVTMTNATPGVITWTAHGLANNEKVMFQNNQGTLPTPLLGGTVYYVRNKTTNTFEISTTSGGASIAITSADLGGNTGLAMPPGLTLNSATGEIAGTPTRAGFYNIQASLSEGLDNVGRGGLNLSVFAVNITTPGSLPNATQGAAYSTQIDATGGGMAFTSSGVPGGTGGLSLNSSGVLSSSGSPVTLSPGLYSFNVTATTGGVSYTKRMSVNVVGAPPTLPRIQPYQNVFTDCVVGFPCSVGVSVFSGGTAPFTWSQSGLPLGLSIRTAGDVDPTPGYTPQDAEIFGNATVAGSYPVTITVTDSSVPPTSATNTFTLKVSELLMTGSPVVTWTRGSFTSQPLRVLGGPSVPVVFDPAPNGATLYTAALLDGTPPAGVSLQAGPPLYSGIPTENIQVNTRLRFTRTSSGQQVESTYFFSVGGGGSTIQINTGSNLGTATASAAFSQTLSACCTPNSIDWSNPGGGLPPGLSLSSGGTLSASSGAGGMTTPGNYTFLVRAEDHLNAANFGTRQFTLTVTPLSITQSSNLPAGNVGTPYSQPLTATGGGGGGVTFSLMPYNYLPPGLGISNGGGSGLLSGMPTQAGQYSFQVKVSDNSTASFFFKNFTLSIYPAGAFPPVNLTIGPNFGPFAVGVVSIAISNTSATGGTGTGYVYSWSPSATPIPGMRIQNGPPFPTTSGFGASSVAGIMGVVSTPAVYNTSIRVTDSVGNFFDRAIVVTVSPLQILSVTTLPKATMTAGYGPITLTPYGGTSYSWSASNMPAGITINSSTGVISGTPTSSGNFNPMITLTNIPTSQSLNVGFTLTVNAFEIATAGVLPQGTVGSLYSQVLAAACGAPCTWSVTNGNLPSVASGQPNFSVAGGTLIGTPNSTYNSSFTLQVAGSNGTVQKVFSLQIKNALPQTLAITTPSAIYSTVGSGVTQQIAASGGSGIYNWTLDSGTLPTGIIINPDGALIGGTLNPGFMYLGPRAMEVGTYNFVLKVTDSVGAFVTRAFTWKVAAVNEQYTSIPFNGSSITVGTPFSQQLLGLGGLAVSGMGSYVWTNTTPLPYGLTLDSNTGLLSGTPLEQPASSNFPIQLTDNAVLNGGTIVTNVFLNFANPPGTLNWNATAFLGTFNQGTTFTSILFNPATAGGTAPYAVTALTALPAGMSLVSGDSLASINGTNQPVGSTVLSGMPQAPGNYSFTLRVEDSAAGTHAVRVRTFTFSVAAFTLGISNTLPNGAVGEPYSQTLQTWGAGAVTWAPSANTSLPPGLSVVGGVLAGTPTQASPPSAPAGFSFNLDGTDASGIVRTTQFTLAVASTRITSPQALPIAIVGIPFNYLFTASGSVTWTFTSSLPSGLSLSTGGVLSGTPTSAGTFTLNLNASPTGGGTSENRRFVLYVRFPNPSVLDVSMGSTALTDATVGQVASYALTNSGGLPPYTWTVAGGSTLPAGLSLVLADSLGSPIPNAFTNIGGVNINTVPGGTLLAGVPTVAGSYTFDLIVTDTTVPVAQAARRTFTLKVSQIGTVAGTPRNVTAGVVYSQQFTAFGGTPPYAFTMSAVSLTQDMLPPGLNLSGTGLISGTTTSTGNYAFFLRIEDSAGGGHNVFTRRYSLVSANATGLLVSSVNPPDVSLGVGQRSFEPQVQMTNFSFPPTVTWSLASGAFPPGVSLINGPPFVGDDEWSVAGQPTAVGTYNFVLRATQVGVPSNTADHAFTWRVVPMQQVTPPTIGTIATDLPPAQVGVFYTTTIKMAGGTPPYTFAPNSLVPFPAGMSLSSSGVVSGTPTSIGSFSIFPVVTDSAGSPNVLRGQAITFLVTPAGTPPPLTFVTNLDVADVTIGATYNFPLDLMLRGGTPPFTWNVQAGSSLPAGLALLPGANGVSSYLAGVPTGVPSSSNFNLEAHDSGGQTTALPFHLEFAPLSLTPDSLPAGIVGIPYPATQFTAAGGTGPYQILVYPGADFPPGLTLSATGLLQGTPTAAGIFTTFIVAIDSTGNSFGDRLFTMAIDNPTIPIPLGEAPAVSLSPTPIQLTHTTGTSDPAPTPISINATSGTFSYGLSIAGVPGASVSAGTGTAPDTSSIVWNLSGVGVGTYHGILGTRAGSVNLIDQVPVTLTVLAPCSYGVNPTSGSAPAAGGFGSFSVSAAADCAWTAAPVSSPWITITSASSGSGPANITYSIAANASVDARIGTIDVQGVSYSITQFGTGCAFAISPISLSAPAAGGTAVISIVASGPSCVWPASDFSASPASGSGSGSVTITVPS